MAHDIQNISSTGFYLVTTERWHPGTVVTMTLQRTDIPDANASSEGYITVLSKVIRMGEDGVGFEFIPQPESSGQAESRTRESAGKKALGRFIERLKSDQGHVIIWFTAENTTENQEMNVIGPGCKFGNAWRDRYEKTY
jgi:hypothetical protein